MLREFYFGPLLGVNRLNTRRTIFSKTFGKVEKGTKHILPIERGYQLTKRLRLIEKLLSVCGVLWKEGGEIRGEILLR